MLYAPDSNLDMETGYPDKCSCFLSVPPRKRRDSMLNSLNRLLYKYEHIGLHIVYAHTLVQSSYLIITPRKCRNTPTVNNASYSQVKAPTKTNRQYNVFCLTLSMMVPLKESSVGISSWKLIISIVEKQWTVSFFTCFDRYQETYFTVLQPI
jgi:hypothetical protein